MKTSAMLATTCLWLFLTWQGIDATAEPVKTYRGFKVFRINVSNKDSLNALLQLEQRPNDFNVWNYPRPSTNSMLISVSPAGLSDLRSIVDAYNLTYKLASGDLGRDISRQNHLTRIKRSVRKRAVTRRSAHQNYRSYEELMSVIDRYPREFPFVQVENVAKTVEGREVKGLMISKNKSNPIIWIDAGIHAREWIASASVMYFTDRLFTRGGQKLLDDYQFFIIPLLNPDGYAYSQSRDRLWRKNRVPVPGEYCMGTDLNRNFPLKWGTGTGASARVCDETHRGPHAASEEETKGVIRMLKQFQGKLKLFLSLHSYGQYLLTPYGYAKHHYTKNHDDKIRLGKLVSKTIRDRYGYIYQVGSASDLLYEASGASDDYAAGMLNVPYTYTMELLDEGRYGFLLPPSYIRVVGRQVWTAVKVMALNM